MFSVHLCLPRLGAVAHDIPNFLILRLSAETGHSPLSSTVLRLLSYFSPCCLLLSRQDDVFCIQIPESPAADINLILKIKDVACLAIKGRLTFVLGQCPQLKLAILEEISFGRR